MLILTGKHCSIASSKEAQGICHTVIPCRNIRSHRLNRPVVLRASFSRRKTLFFGPSVASIRFLSLIFPFSCSVLLEVWILAVVERTASSTTDLSGYPKERWLNPSDSWHR
jgi:hypothetical protein